MTTERGILFKGAMVKAILSGAKTQTRRIVSLQGRLGYPVGEITSANAEGFKAGLLEFSWKCPFGKIGDHLWVKETFAYTDSSFNVEPGYVYRATDPDWSSLEGFKWTPSIFMPRRARRITMEITGIRVQKLSDINGQDSIAEGIEPYTVDGITTFKDYCTGRYNRSARASYESLWNSIHSKPKPIYGKDKKITHYVSYPWVNVQETREHRGKPWHVHGNPLVWALEFKRVK